VIRLPGYRLLEPVARSAATEVWRATTTAGTPVAIKLLHDPSDDLALRFAAEGRLLAGAGGRDGVIGCVEFRPDPPALVLEWFGHPTFAEWVAGGGVGQTDAVVRIVRDATRAVRRLHAHGIVHRDVKASNLLVGPEDVRLIDLGVAASGHPPRALPDDWIEEEVGTPGWSAPELILEPGLATPALDVSRL
jgi:serine/threonine protein kinase